MHLQRPLSGYYYKLFENNPPCVIINSDGTLQPSSSSRKKPRRRPSSLSLLDVPARFLKKRIITCQSAKLFHPHQKQQENIIMHRLPTEILIHILSYLGCADVMEASKTCRELYRLCQDNDVWHALFSRRYFEITPAANTPCMRKLFQDHAELDRRWRDGEAYATFLDGDQHQDSVYALKYLNSSDPSGVVLVSGSRDRTLRIWRDGFAQPQVIETPHQGSVLCLATSSSWVVSASSDTTCVVWSLPDWQPTHVLRGHTASVVDVCFVTPNAIATGSKDGSLRIWYLEEKDWQAKQIFLEAHARSITAIQTWGKHHVVSASADEKVKIWCLQTEQCVRTLTSNVGGLACLCVTDNVIYAGGLDGKLQAWDAKTGRCLWVSQHAHHNMVRAIDCFQGRIVTGGYDKTLKVWDASTGRCLLTFHSGHDGFIFKVLVSRTRIVSAGMDRQIMVLDFGRGLTPVLARMF